MEYAGLGIFKTPSLLFLLLLVGDLDAALLYFRGDFLLLDPQSLLLLLLELGLFLLEPLKILSKLGLKVLG